jgi:hypothetical protein
MEEFGRSLISRTKLVANQEDTGEARHGLVNLDLVEMEADLLGRNEIGHRFLDGDRLRIAVDFENGERQRSQLFPEAKLMHNSPIGIECFLIQEFNHSGAAFQLRLVIHEEKTCP